MPLLAFWLSASPPPAAVDEEPLVALEPEPVPREAATGAAGEPSLGERMAALPLDRTGSWGEGVCSAAVNLQLEGVDVRVGGTGAAAGGTAAGDACCCRVCCGGHTDEGYTLSGRCAP